MKRIILLGVVMLFAASMTMAADIDIDSTVSMSGDYSGDILHVGVAADGTINLSGHLQADGVIISDTTVGASGTVNVGADLILDVNTINISCGFMGTLNVEGTLNVSSWLNYDGNPAAYNPATGLYAQLNVSGNGQINGGAHMIYGGYGAAYPFDMTISDNAVVSGGVSPMYVGGPSGSGTCVMSDNATLQNLNGVTAGLYDNLLNIGTSDPAEPGTLTVESGNTVKFRHLFYNNGTAEYILDAAGQVCTMEAFLPDDADPEGNLDCIVRFYDGNEIDLDTSGVAGGILVPGYAIDLVTTVSASMLQWDTPGLYEASLAADDVLAGWKLREKPGDATTLQAYIIPEPTTMALLGLGSLLVAMRRRS